MKVKILAVIAFVTIITAVTVNTGIIYKHSTKLYEIVEKIDLTAEEASGAAKAAYEYYKNKESYISLTVNHEDLTNIEDAFNELIGYLDVDMKEEAQVTKNRLLCFIEHLGRLSGINIDAII